MVVTGWIRGTLVMFGLLLTAVQLLTAQQSDAAAHSAAPTHAPRVLEVYFDASTLAVTADTRVFLYETLVQQLRAIAPDASLVEPVRSNGNLFKGEFPAVPATETERTTSARAANADSWLLVTLSGTMDATRISYTFSDLLFPARSVSGSYRTVIDSRLRNLAGPFWAALLDQLRGRLSPRSLLVDVRFLGPDGTRVVDESNKARSVIIRSGQGILKVSAPGTYRFSVHRSGYYPSQVSIRVEQQETTVSLPMDRKSPLLFDFTLEDLSFPKLRVNYQVLPEWLYLSAGVQTYLAGLTPLGSNSSSGPSLFSSSGVSNVVLGAGTYLSSPDGVWNTFRFYVNVLGFLRLDTTPTYIGIDPILPYGGQLELGAEILPQSKVRGLFAVISRVYVATDNALAAAYAGNRGNDIFFHFIDGYVIEFPTMYLGVRFQP